MADNTSHSPSPGRPGYFFRRLRLFAFSISAGSCGDQRVTSTPAAVTRNALSSRSRASMRRRCSSSSASTMALSLGSTGGVSHQADRLALLVEQSTKTLSSAIAALERLQRVQRRAA